MSKRQAAWWLLGHPTAEASYGAGVDNAALTKWYRTEEPVLVSVGGEETTDEGEIKGFVGVSSDGADLVKKRGEVSVTMRPNLQMIGHLLKAMFANDAVTGASDPYTHEILQPTTAVIRPNSFSVITGEDRADPATQWKHNGVVPSSIRMAWASDNPQGELSFTLVTDGDPTDASAVSAPAVGTALKGDRLRFEHLALSFGAQGAAADVTSILRSVEITIEGDLQEEQRASRGTALGTVFHGPNAPTVEATIVLEGKEGDAYWSLWRNRTLCEMALVGTISGSRSFRLEANALMIPQDAGGVVSIENGIVQVLTLPLRLHYHAADSSAYVFTVKNDIAAYLA